MNSQQRCARGCLALVLAVLTSCSPSPDPPGDGGRGPDPSADAIGSIQITPGGADLEINAQMQFRAEVRNTRGEVVAGAPIAWRSTDSKIVRVDSEGLAQAAAPGNAYITATVLTTESAPAMVRVKRDTTAPLFEGLQAAWADSPARVALAWSPAMDDISPPGDVVYRVYVSANPEMEFAAPAQEIKQGRTNAMVEGQTPGSRMFFAVRAVDAAGNTDLNTRVLPVTLPMEGPLAGPLPRTRSVAAGKDLLFLRGHANPWVLAAWADGEAAVFEEKSSGEPVRIASLKRSSPLTAAVLAPGERSFPLLAGAGGGDLFLAAWPATAAPPRVAAVSAVEPGEEIHCLDWQDDVLYAGGKGSLAVVDVASPETPVIARRVVMGDTVRRLARDSQAQRLAAASPGGVLTWLDIRTPLRPEPRSSFVFPPDPAGLGFAGGSLYAAFQDAGIQVYQVNDSRVENRGSAPVGGAIRSWDFRNGYAAVAEGEFNARVYAVLGPAVIPIAIQTAQEPSGAAAIAGSSLVMRNGGRLDWFALPPFVQNTSPRAGEGEVPATATISLGFSLPVDARSLGGALRLDCESKPVDFEVELSPASRAVMLKPGQPLPANASCQARAGGGVRGLNGAPLFPRDGFTLLFSTAGNGSIAPVISGIEPNQAPPGGRFTIRGRNFDPDPARNIVTINDERARVMRVEGAGETLIAETPANAVSGPVTVTTPRGAVTRGERFYVLSQPVITSLAPAAGAVGKLVVITGRHFGYEPSTPAGQPAVTLNGAPVEVIQWFHNRPLDNEIQIRIPAGAKSGPVRVATAGGQADSPQPFLVVSDPVIHSIEPPGGVVGAEIAIRGSGFGGQPGQVAFRGAAESPIVSWSNTAVRVKIPPSATNGPVLLSTAIPGVSAVSDQSVAVYVQPSALDFSPQRGGAPETSITLRGSGFNAVRGSGQVLYAGVPLTEVIWSESTLTARLPSGAPDGVFEIVNGGGLRAVFPGLFRVMRIRRLSSTEVVAGGEFFVEGENFGNSPGQLSIGGSAIKSITRWTDTRIEAQLPPDLQPGVVAIQEPGGGQVTGANVEVVLPPRIVSIKPERAPAGGVITITGANFGPRDEPLTEIRIGNTLAPIQSWNDTQAMFIVPAGAQSGVVRLKTRSGFTASSPAPVLVAAFSGSPPFSPGSGTAETEVAISGVGFGAVSGEVIIGGQKASKITSWEDAKIVALVGPSAQDGPISITLEGGAVMTTSEKFILKAPLITSFSPARAGPGMDVTLQGENFQGQTGDSKVSAGGVTAQIIKWNPFTPGPVVFRTPNNPAFTGKIEVINAAGKKGESASSFEFVPAPTATGFTPSDGPGNTLIEITGANFTNQGSGSRVWFVRGGSRVAAIPEPFVNANKLKARTPFLATDRYQIQVETEGGVAAAPGEFQVFGAPAITAFSPPNGLVADQITLSGGDFEPSLASNATAKLGDLSAPIVSTALNQMVIEIPAGARDGLLSINTRAGGTQSARRLIINKTSAAQPLGSGRSVNVIRTGRIGVHPRAWVVSSASNELLLVDLDAASVLQSTALASSINALAYDDTAEVLLGAGADGVVRRWNASTLAALPPITPSGAASIAGLELSGTSLWVCYTAGTQGRLEKFDLNSLASTAGPIAVGSNPRACRINPALPRVYVLTGGASPSVVAVDSSALTVAGTWPVGANPGGLALTGDGKRAIVANRDSASLSFIVLTGDAGTTSTLTLAGQPLDIVLDKDSSRAWVPLATRNTLAIVDVDDSGGQPSSNPTYQSWWGEVALGALPTAVALAPAGADGSPWRVLTGAGASLIPLDDTTKVNGPRVFRFSPSQGAPGTSITVNGASFGASPGAQHKVFVGNAQATAVASWTDAQIQFTLPAGAADGPIRVETPNGVSFSRSPFDVQ